MNFCKKENRKIELFFYKKYDFCPLLPTFIWAFKNIFLFTKNTCAHFFGLLPTFKNKSGHEKPRKIKGLRALCPLAHFFSIIN